MRVQKSDYFFLVCSDLMYYIFFWKHIINKQTDTLLHTFTYTHSSVPLSSLLLLDVILVQRSNNTRFYINVVFTVLT